MYIYSKREIYNIKTSHGAGSRLTDSLVCPTREFRLRTPRAFVATAHSLLVGELEPKAPSEVNTPEHSTELRPAPTRRNALARARNDGAGGGVAAAQLEWGLAAGAPTRALALHAPFL
jgi:hypothetical protein